MKEFLKNNTITYNLMSFTGFKAILIFSYLVEAPRSYEDIQKMFSEHEYLNEKISIDAIRIYINSLKEIGCEIERIPTTECTKFQIKSHPLMLKFSTSQVKSIIKTYKAISKDIELEDLISLQEFFNKISQYVADEKLKIKLNNISPIRNIDLNLIDELKKYAKNNTEIVILYNSPVSGRKNITIVVDNLKIRNGKLYVEGFNSEYQNYSSFLVSKIIKIVSVNIEKRILNVPSYTVGYRYTGDKFELSDNEKIIEETLEYKIIEISSKNKFVIMQRLMSMTNKCKILYPESFKSEFVACLKNMKAGYNDEC